MLLQLLKKIKSVISELGASGMFLSGVLETVQLLDYNI